VKKPSEVLLKLKISTNFELPVIGEVSTVLPNRTCALRMFLHNQLWNFRFGGDTTAAEAEAIRAVAQKSVEKEIL